ncbi:AAA family ATPase [Calothrix sp. FACHB-1219]|uniref:DnaB-like helicase N-terminal domain-containing protein n=1 Tax=unclassified Calothrix TaxID=2619626 RepID=UPI001685EEBF|nr:MULTISPECIES: DnaB-like helicase N-terminal domain-containing protein [unclassified Calothrix]MBD2204946.1 AAA family ATPase [Calothrix sp. FACHB-168]MBD2216229.1 AAA family ATPase [Calothrix sp. FACHB-1219]
MTQGIYPFPSEQLDFRATNDRLPPCNIDAEVAIIGGILVDSNAIYRVKDRLKPEHFFIRTHALIYQECLRLCKQEQPTDLLTVESKIRDKYPNKKEWRSTLAKLVDAAESTVNIDALAALVIQKAVRRDLIKVFDELYKLGYDTETEFDELRTITQDKIRSVIEHPVAPTREEYQQWKHDRLLDELTTIYTTCTQPSLKLLKLKDLANEHHLSINFLELLYLKSLTAQCTKLLTYKELKELAGSTVREWLLNGLVPKATTILLAADGGIGKTKLTYGIGKVIIQGTQFGKFTATGEKRKILYYQGDESPGDMVQALESLGYSEDDIDKHVRVRFGWSAENMPVLIQDLKEFQPDFVVIDSLSTANKYSVYQESQMEYARPILEMTGLAIQYNTTFLIIHHTNREGGVRGTTAIRNAVSEVWTLAKDNSQSATPYDRLLTIDKSRSRSSGKKYRLMFSPEDLSFTFLGEDVDQFVASEQSAKDALLDFFKANRNIKFTSKELSHRLGYSDGHTRSSLSALSADGLISAERRPGHATNYYLAWENGDDHPDDHPSNRLEILARTEIEADSTPCIIENSITLDHPTITPDDHPIDLDTASDTAEGDRLSTEKSLLEKVEPEKNNLNFSPSADHLRPEPSPDNNSRGDRGGDREVIVQSPPTTDELPLIEEKAIYWSKSLGCKVEIFNIVDALGTVGAKAGKRWVTLNFADLRPCEESPKHNFSVTDQVVILCGKHQDKLAVISSIGSAGIFLNCERKLIKKAFFPHQLAKM